MTLGLIVGATLGVTGLAILPAMIQSSAAKANSQASQEDGYVPQAERVPLDERDWMTSKELAPMLQGSFDKVTESLGFPSAESQEHARRVLADLKLDTAGAYEKGMEDQIVLDTWQCEWASYAENSFTAGNRDGVARAGEALMKRIDFPGQVELLPDWKVMSAQVIQPLVAGDYQSVSEFWNYQCSVASGDEPVSQGE